MVTRQYIDSTSVKSIIPPKSGEKFVLDTKLRQFGVRIWISPSGKVGYSYFVRVKNHEGKFIRKTFNFWNHYFQHLDWFEGNELNLIELLQNFSSLATVARRWALLEVDAITRNFPELVIEQKQQRDWIKKKTEQYSMQTIADNMIRNRRIASQATTHIDRLDMLFHKYIPGEFRKSRMKNISGQALWSVLAKSKVSKNELAILKPFIVEIDRSYGNLSGERPTIEKYYNKKNFLHLDELSQNVVLKKWKAEDFDNFKADILQTPSNIQQAHCIWLYLHTNFASLTAAMSAKREDFICLPRKKYFRSNATQAMRWIRGNNFRNIEDFDENLIAILKLVFEHSVNTEKDSVYLFPSNTHWNKKSITTVQRTWENILKENNIPFVTLKEFRSFDQNCIRPFSHWF